MRRLKSKDTKKLYDSVIITCIIGLVIIAVIATLSFSTLSVEGEISGKGTLNIDYPVDLELNELTIRFRADIPLLLIIQFENILTELETVSNLEG